MNMRTPTRIMVRKASGELEAFSEKKLRRSLERAGADRVLAEEVAAHVARQAFDGMATRQVHDRAFAMLKAHRRSSAARYGLKRALFALGPSGFPFERFAARLFDAMGYTTSVGVILDGRCVRHEVDIVLTKGATRGYAECKFHTTPGGRCDVQVPLYVRSRFEDLCEAEGVRFDRGTGREGWLVTNTRFTRDALAFASCSGIKAMGWDVGELGESIERLIDARGLHPVTCLTTLNASHKALLLSQGIVLCQDLLRGTALTRILGLAAPARARVLEESREVCGHPGQV